MKEKSTYFGEVVSLNEIRKNIINGIIEEISKENQKYCLKNQHSHNGYFVSSFASELIINLNKLK